MAKIPDIGFHEVYFEFHPKPLSATEQELREMLVECACLLEAISGGGGSIPGCGEGAHKARALLAKVRTP